MTSPEIVFVHLNSKVPKYLRLNIASISKQFPENRITLVTDQNVSFKLRNVTVSKVNDLSWVGYDDKLKHPKTFRKNFWFLSIARFFALEEYLKENGDIPIIHVESDVIMASDFPLDKFELLNNGLAYPIISAERGIASSIYIRDLKSIEKLNEFTRSEIQRDPYASDMTILGNYYRSFPGLVAPLPFGPKGRLGYLKCTPSHLFNEMERNSEILGGVVDGNDFGLFYFGTDPRNLRGRSTFRRKISDSYGDLNHWRISLQSHRDFPYVQLSNSSQSLPIFSLHATCKRPNLFRLSTRGKVIKRRVNSALLPEHEILYPTVFVKQAANFLFRKLFT